MKPKKSLGQNWLIDNNSLEQIISCANLTSSDQIIEIGPGTGNLTKLLAPQVSKVIAIEIDSTLYRHLLKININNVNLINQDIREFNFNDIAGPYKIVANIPYYLTSRLIRIISETENRADLVVLLVQKEIAERLSAGPGKYSILGLNTQLYWEVVPGPIILKDKFEPIPKVDSQVVIFKPKELPKGVDIKKLTWLIKIGFKAKRKTLFNNLKSSQIEITRINQELKALSLSPMVRPSELSMNDWIRLSKSLL